MDSDESPVARRGRRRQVRTAHTRPALAETNPAPKRRLCRAEVSPEPNREAEARAEAPTVAPLRRSRRLKGLPAEEEEMQDEVPRTNRSGHESDDAQDLPSAPEKPRPRPSLLEDESDDAEEVSPASGKLARPASGLLDEESEELARSMAKTSSGKRCKADDESPKVPRAKRARRKKQEQPGVLFAGEVPWPARKKPEGQEDSDSEVERAMREHRLIQSLRAKVQARPQCEPVDRRAVKQAALAPSLSFDLSVEDSMEDSKRSLLEVLPPEGVCPRLLLKERLEAQVRRELAKASKGRRLGAGAALTARVSGLQFQW
ncbi:unnamed protein product [Effrenium voratum]|nr:unnamed protein product [Effrenium voratum]